MATAMPLLMPAVRRGLCLRPQRPTLLLKLGLVLLLSAVAAPVLGFFLDHHPKTRGDSYSYTGEGERPDGDGFFFPGDVYTDVTLEDWDLDAVSSLQLPPTVQKLTLARCNLSSFPAEILALEHLQELNLPYNRLVSVEGAIASASTLKKLNVSNNQLQEYNMSLPALASLDLSSNALTAFPSAVFTSAALDALFMAKNEFQIVSMTTAQFDFFAGLTDLQIGFADVKSCAEGTLVYLKGRGVCRLDVEGAADPGVVPRDHSATPAPTVGVVIPGLPPNADSHTTKKYLMIAVIILVVLGAGAAITMLVSLGIVGGIARAVYDYIFKKRQQRYREAIHEATPLFFDNDKRADYQKELAANDKLFPSHDPVLVTWRIDYDAVALVEKLSQGAFGEVWIGRYRGNKVAVKRLLQDQVSLETSENFLREIKLMAWLEHPKIVQFIGVAWTKLVDMLAVIEFMDSGDLRSLLEKNPQLKWKESRKLQYAIDTIDAIVYLHSLSPVIIHRDLKSRNILIDSKHGAKLGDFGVSATKRPRDMTTGVGTARWLAPELARGEEHYTEAVDIYSFGVILAELDTHELPFADATNATGDKLSDFGILQGVATGTLQVSFTSQCPPKLLELARRCTAFDPKERPAAAEIAYELRKRDILL